MRLKAAATALALAACLGANAGTKVVVALPFNASTNADARFLDLYLGAMLAVRDLGNCGYEIDLSSLDTGTADSTAIAEAFRANDIIIGPFFPAEYETMLQYLPENKYLISPLNPKTASFTDANRVIMAATPVSEQIRDCISWMKDDMSPADSLLLIREADIWPNANVRIMDKELFDLADTNSFTLSYLLSDGPKAIETFSAHTHLEDSSTVCMVLSDNDVFVKDAIRNISLQGYMKKNVRSYGIAKSQNADIEELCSSAMHMSASFYIDYGSEKVKKFILDYRALFNADPDSFAFHGYDMIHYFVNMFDIYGEEFPDHLHECGESGLQTNFIFNEVETEGHVNSGIRRIVYSKGLKVKRIR